MKLSEFIAETITEICDGVRQAGENELQHHKKQSGHGGWIEKKGGLENDRYTAVEFDVMVTSQSGSKDELGGGITVLEIFKAKASTEQSDTITEANRIKFTVPLPLPKAH